MNALTIHTAEMVIPIVGEPIARGAVAIVGTDIVDVGAIDDLAPRHPLAEVTEWQGVMMPGLVNAHTHLQYTGFDAVGATRYPDYTTWSERFVEEYDRRTNDDWAEAARLGADLSLRSGVTCIADVVTDWEARWVLFELGIPGVAFLELIGTDQTQWDSALRRELVQVIETAPASDTTSLGVSPHAPYSVDETVLTAAATTARELGVRIHIHVGESDSEDEYYRTGTGALAERVRQVAHRRLSLLDSGGAGMGTAEFVASLGLLGDDCHIAHGVYLGPEGRAIMAAKDTVVALCPRSNINVGIDPPPVADFLTERVPFAIGTDSLGSSPSLDPRHDLALLRSLALAGGYTGSDLDRRLLHAATLGGARALGLDQRLGSLEPGKRADFAVFNAESRVGDVVNEMVASPGTRCLATIIGGHLRFVT